MSDPNTVDMIENVVGFFCGIFCFPIFCFFLKVLTVEVEDETQVLVTRFGKLVKIFKNPGLHFFPENILPWVTLLKVSLQLDYRNYQNIQVNDSRGTSVIIDFWIEFRIAQPEKALFEVENWEHSFQSLVTHSATSILCTQNYAQILCNRTELGNIIQNEIIAETARWGLEIEMVMIQKVSLLAEVSRHMFGTVAAKLERAKADVEEEGRLKVAQLEANTAEKVAGLVAEAKGQYPLSIGRAFSALSLSPDVYSAYQELYELSLVRPHRTVAFSGFSKSDVREIDALLVAPSMGELGSKSDNSFAPPQSTIEERRLTL